MSYKPDFTILNKEYILKKFEEILIVIPEVPLTASKYNEDENLEGFFDLMSVKSISDEDLGILFHYLEDFENLKDFYNRFMLSISKINTDNYRKPKSTFAFSISIRGFSQIQIINYFIYFIMCFFENKDALLKIYDREIYTDEFGIKNQTNWKKKFKSLFENIIIKNHHFDNRISRKDFYNQGNQLNIFFNNICELFIYLSEKIKNIETKKNQSQKNEYYNSSSEKGINFEKECSLILERNGWITNFTPKTGDQGADIIANKGKIKLVVQCKFYKNSVGNDAVQQIISAKSFFDATIAAVVSKSGFTKSAKILAEKTSVLLLSISDLNDI